MNQNLKKLLPHIVVIIGFIIISLAYFNPVLKGKVIFQSDIQQSKGMNRQKADFKDKTGTDTYWVDNAFGGMPTYLLGADYPYNFIKKIDHTIRFLPRPADYLFLYFIGLYILFLTLKVDYKLAAVGALAFGFSTYLIIIIGVGHNAKAHAIAYMPVVIAGILCVFKKNYWWGGLLLCLGLALEIFTGHFQITYYLLLCTLILGAVFLYDAIRKKQVAGFFKSVGVMLIAVVLAVSSNATTLLASREYTDFSTRGDTGLTITKDGQTKARPGMDYEYITEYSYGLAETLNLFIPRFTGGASSSESLGENSHTYQRLIAMGVPPAQALQFLQHAPTYWGKQPIVAAPNYIGAVVIFLFILALYLVKGRLKWWVVGSGILALLLSWGDNFSTLTRFFINYVPLYDKFRTVAMIQVLLQLLIPFFGIYGLSRLFSERIELKKKLKALKNTVLITGTACLVLLIFKTWLFDFTGTYDMQYAQNISPDFVKALRQDRVAMLNADTLRSLVFVLLTAGMLWLYLKDKLKQSVVIAALGLLILVDLVSVDTKYVNADHFVNRSYLKQAFTPTEADKEIRKDQTHYRVLDLSVNPMKSARASFFHNSIGGYHAAKPGRMQELFDFYLSEGNQQVINMLNTKYFIIENDGKTIAQHNYETNGNAWFVTDIEWADTADDEMTGLGAIDTKKTAVLNKSYQSAVGSSTFAADSTTQIKLTDYQPNHLIYEYHTDEDRLAVFAEIYYPHGWEVKVDGQPVEMLRANYVLRAVMLPAGSHQVTFQFNPQVVKTGSSITLASGILLILLIIGGLIFSFRNKPESQS